MFEKFDCFDAFFKNVSFKAAKGAYWIQKFEGNKKNNCTAEDLFKCQF